MTAHRPDLPSEDDAAEIVRASFGARPAQIRRFATGIGHWVYEARLAGGDARVVKLGLASRRDDFVGAVHWSTTLRPLGVPLPELIARGEHRGFPYLVLERLQGEDLEHVYLRLSSPERHRTEGLSAYFSQVPPTPFLDDVTTKNVLVYEGKLSGIVDVDWVCFGDPLFTVALTRAAILSAGYPPDYTDHWCALLGVTRAQAAAVRFYAALFCVDFISEAGQTFNRSVETLDPARAKRLTRVLEEHLRASP